MEHHRPYRVPFDAETEECVPQEFTKNSSHSHIDLNAVASQFHGGPLRGVSNHVGTTTSRRSRGAGFLVAEPLMIIEAKQGDQFCK